MTIHIDWQVLPSPHGEKYEQLQLCPRLADNEIVDFRDLCKMVPNHSSKINGIKQID